MSKERAPWPQCYYDELDARKRKDLLDKAKNAIKRKKAKKKQTDDSNSSKEG